MSAHALLAGILLSAALSFAAAPGGRKPKTLDTIKRRSNNAWAEITSATAHSSYLNRGAKDGLSEGQLVPLLRGKKKAGVCKVAALSDHFARCEGDNLQVGDRTSIRRAVSTKPLTQAPEFTSTEIAKQARALESQQWALREFDNALASRGTRSSRLEAHLIHTSFIGAPSGSFGVQQVGIRAYDVEIWRGLRVSADANLIHFAPRPTATRTVYQRTPVLLVRQLEVGFRRDDIPFSVALGRTWLPVTPGLLVVDGGQAAWRINEAIEVGAFGGLLPDAAQLTITPSQWTAGAYSRVRLLLGEAAHRTSVHLGVRAGWSNRTSLGGRAEVGLSASLWTRSTFDATTQLELGFGSTQAAAGIDAARLDMRWRPHEALQFNTGVRYRGMALTGLTEIGAAMPGQRALHGDLGAVWTPSPWLGVAARAGVASDFDSQLLQARVGPEVLLPRLGALPVGLALGYQEELGWLRGRSGYFQLAFNFEKWVRLWARANWFEQQATATASGLAAHELGSSILLEIAPWPFLRARAIASGRLPIASQASPFGSISVQLVGTL